MKKRLSTGKKKSKPAPKKSLGTETQRPERGEKKDPWGDLTNEGGGTSLIPSSVESFQKSTSMRQGGKGGKEERGGEGI